MYHWQIYADKLDKVMKSAKTHEQKLQALAYKEITLDYLWNNFGKKTTNTVEEYLRTKRN